MGLMPVVDMFYLVHLDYYVDWQLIESLKQLGSVVIVDTNSEKRWLKLMKIGRGMGCHQKHCRSFFYKGYQFPLCARCTGIVIGEIIIAPIVLIFGFNHIILNLVLLFLMALDGILQYYHILESNNIRRLVTGLGAGFALTSSLVWLIQQII